MVPFVRDHCFALARHGMRTIDEANIGKGVVDKWVIVQVAVLEEGWLDHDHGGRNPAGA